MGFTRRLVRKSVRKATPRTVRKVVHPVRTTRNAVTPRSVKQLSRAAYTVTNPLGAAENALIGSLLNPAGGRRRAPSGPRAGSARAAQGTSDEIFIGTGARANAALESAQTVAALMSVQRQRFAPAKEPVVPDPPAPDVPALAAQMWDRLDPRERPNVWRRAQRKEVRLRLGGQAAKEAAALHRAALAQAATDRAAAHAWWTRLQAGDAEVLQAALTVAFADNPAPTIVRSASGAYASVLIHLPPPELLGAKQAHVTASGRLSSRNWPKGELHHAYASLLAAHLLATAREAWAVGPSLTTLRVTAVRSATDVSKPTEVVAGLEVLFDVDLDRASGSWADDHWGEAVLAHQAGGLRRLGKSATVAPWPVRDLPPATIDAVCEARAEAWQGRG